MQANIVLPTRIKLFVFIPALVYGPLSFDMAKEFLMIKNEYGRRVKLYRPKHPLQIRIVSFLGSYAIWAAMHLLFLTCRIRVFGAEILEDSKRAHSGRMLGASWHRGLLFTVFYFRNLGAALMTSRSKDGELLTAMLKRFGYTPPRGSSGKDKGGKQALEEFVGLIQAGKPAGIATDGPNGPPYISKFGVIAAAARTGIPIIPFSWSAQPCFRINSWDRTMIPKPFSRIVMIFDCHALEVPADPSQEQMEGLRRELDDRINYLTYQADHYCGREDQFPDPRNIPVPSPIPPPEHPAKKSRRTG
ncbi:MAG: hypothetical protein CVU54_03100 [Deltaproteobacteria bacterium HGW-Deltaproteobacteria-12]|nr:MAG: hypothetical protein CVU54_03100 [Deltaproteobacteria bacterium HGW-Deltaproteobacteria-12]